MNGLAAMEMCWLCTSCESLGMELGGELRVVSDGISDNGESGRLGSLQVNWGSSDTLMHIIFVSRLDWGFCPMCHRLSLTHDRAENTMNVKLI